MGDWFENDEFEQKFTTALKLYLHHTQCPEDHCFLEIDDHGLLQAPKHEDWEELSPPIDPDERVMWLAELRTFDDVPSLSPRDFVDLIESARDRVVLNPSTIRFRESTFAAVEPDNIQAEFNFAEGPIEGIPPAALSPERARAGWAVEVVRGLNPCHLARYFEGEWFSDYQPAYQDQDRFIRVDHPVDASDAEILDLVIAYRFELAATAGLALSPRVFLNRPNPEYPYGDADWDELESGSECSNLRALEVGPGLAELQSLFLQAESGSLPTQYRVVEYAKALEYVSRTAARQKTHHLLAKRLAVPEAANPGADLLDSIVKLVDENGPPRTDAHALLVTLEACCDAEILAAGVPPEVVARATGNKTPRDVVKALAKAISSTRNSIVHAKANYTPDGDEVESAQLDSLVAPLRLAALMSLRWYARLPSSHRVLPQ